MGHKTRSGKLQLAGGDMAPGDGHEGAVYHSNAEPCSAPTGGLV
jgi:hypothetical protein